MATNAATLVSRINSELTRPVPRDTSTATLNRWHEILVKALSKLEVFQTKEKSIVTNTSLSDEGKQKQLVKLAQDSLGDWEWLGRILHDIEAAQARFTTLLFTIEPTVKDDLLRYLRAREVRDGMDTLNQNDRDVAYIKASEQSQLEVLLAMQTAPAGNWITPEIQQRTDRERAKRAQPGAFIAYEQNELLHERVAGIADHLAHWLRSYGAPPATVGTALGVA